MKQKKIKTIKIEKNGRIYELADIEVVKQSINRGVIARGIVGIEPAIFEHGYLKNAQSKYIKC